MKKFRDILIYLQRKLVLFYRKSRGVSLCEYLRWPLASKEEVINILLNSLSQLHGFHENKEGSVANRVLKLIAN